MPRRANIVPFPSDPTKSARLAGLRYVKGDGPGIIRVRAGKGFSYLDSDGRPIRARSEVNRMRSLAIPPAWSEVWISPHGNAHIQAHGRDARGRKQYRYHPLYRRVRDETKYGRMLSFGNALVKIREQVESDLKLPDLPKRKVVAAVVKLLDWTGMRIGNDEYVRQNDSFGLTTLRDKHVDIAGPKIRFRFRGKSGQQQDIELSDVRLAKIVRTCRDIPGYELFQYTDENGESCRVDSTDINDYIRETTGEEFTAKDFRTWNGTGYAALALEQIGDFETEAEAKKNIVEAIKMVAVKLGNRPATSKKYYVHPAVLDAYSARTLFDSLKSCKGERREEDCVRRLVEGYLKKLKPFKETGDLTRQLRESLNSRAV